MSEVKIPESNWQLFCKWFTIIGMPLFVLLVLSKLVWDSLQRFWVLSVLFVGLVTGWAVWYYTKQGRACDIYAIQKFIRNKEMGEYGRINFNDCTTDKMGHWFLLHVPNHVIGPVTYKVNISAVPFVIEGRLLDPLEVVRENLQDGISRREAEKRFDELALKRKLGIRQEIDEGEVEEE